MKKGLLAVCFAVCISLTVSARDIKTNDGTVYKDVSISSVTPIGIDISYHKEGVAFIRLLRFTNLSKEIQKEFHYHPGKAKTYLTNLRKHAEMVRKKHAEMLKQKEARDTKHYELLSRVAAGRINVLLKVYSVKGNGIIAWADSLRHDTPSSGHMGKVFVYGMMGLSGTEEARVIYPTGLTMHGYSCYAMTAEQSVILQQNAGK